MAEARVRAYEPTDLEDVAAIMTCPGVVYGTLQVPYRSQDQLRERYTQSRPDVHRLVAEIDGRVVGIIGLHRQVIDRRRHVAEIGMAVHDDFQNRGVGTALMTAVTDLSDNWLGLHRLELSVYTDNAPAIHLYEKFGFVIEGTMRDYAFRDGRYVDAHEMARVRA